MAKQQLLTTSSPERTIELEIVPPTPGALSGLIAVLAAIVARECATSEQEKDAA